MFAGSIDSLAVFGLKPRKVRAAPKPEDQVAAALKAKATRKARMTMGPKQKAKIKGVVPETSPETPPPATAPVAPTATPGPVPAAGAAPRS
jgi:hypothetical protein